MRWLLGTVVTLHGLLHLLGFVKAFGIAELSALQLPIPRAVGIVWLLAAVVVAAAGAAAVWSPRTFWMLGISGAVISQLVLFTSWTDARWGTLGNVILLVAALLGWLRWGPGSRAAAYEHEVREVLRHAAAAEAVPLEALPAPVARYLRVSGALDHPMPRAFRARWRGRIRGGPADPWMTLEAEQVNTLSPMTRLFYLDAVRAGIPAHGLHRFVGEQATMDVRLLGLLRVADGRGEEMSRSETVTLFNDLVLLCPAGLRLPCITWEAIDDTRARGRLENGRYTVTAELVFDPATGQVVDFVSDDRSRSVDGTKFVRARWSTPVRGVGTFGRPGRELRLPAGGEARWHEATTYAYIELELSDVELDPPAPTPARGLEPILA